MIDTAPLLLALLLANPAVAQVTTVPAPAPVQSAPLPPPQAAPATPDPAAPATPDPAAPPAVQTPAPAAQPQPAPPAPVQAQPPATSPAIPADRDATLAGKPGDTMGVDTLVLAPKPALSVAGQTTWDKGLEVLSEIFGRLEAEATRQGLKVAGRPLTHFIETDDIGFRYEAMLPVDRAAPALPAGDIRSGMTPAGNALRFTHKAPYDDIDSTYEGITAYLDAKGLTVRDQFIEEYVGAFRDAADPAFEVNVYVQPR